MHWIYILSYIAFYMFICIRCIFQIPSWGFCLNIIKHLADSHLNSSLIFLECPTEPLSQLGRLPGAFVWLRPEYSSPTQGQVIPSPLDTFRLTYCRPHQASHCLDQVGDGKDWGKVQILILTSSTSFGHLKRLHLDQREDSQQNRRLELFYSKPW